MRSLTIDKIWSRSVLKKSDMFKHDIPPKTVCFCFPKLVFRQEDFSLQNLFHSPFARRTHSALTVRSAAVLTGTALSLILGQAAHAESTGEEAYRAYIQELEALGFKSSNSGIEYNSSTDQLIISNDQWVFEGALPVSAGETETGDETVEAAYKFTYSSGTTTIDGLSEKDGVYTASSWSFSNDTQFEAIGSVEGKGRGKLVARINGMSISNYGFDVPDVPAENADKKVSRWLPFLRTLMLQNFDETKVDAVAMTLEAYEGSKDDEQLIVSGTMQMDGYSVLNSRDGKVERYVMDKVTQNILTRAEHSDDMVSQTTTQIGTVYENVNNAAFIDLFDPAVPASDDRVTVVGSQTVESYESTQEVAPGFAIRMTTGNVHSNDFFVVKRDFDFLGLLDGLLAGQEPSIENLGLGALQLYRSFGVKDLGLKDMTVTAPNPEQPDEEIRVAIGEMKMVDFSSNGIGEMSVSDISAPDLPDGASFKLDRASLGNIEFAEFAPMQGIISQLVADPDLASRDPFLMAKTFTPHSLSVAIDGLDLNVPGEVAVSLNSYVLDLASTVPPIPTSIYTKTDNLVLPVEAIEEPEAQAVLQALGLETVTWSDETRLYWDEETKDLHLEKLVMSLKDLGTVEGTFRFANVAREVFEDPQGQGQFALAMASFVEAEFQFTDEGGTEKGLALAAQDAGVPVEALKIGLAEQAAQSTAALQNEAFTSMVRDAVSKFLENPEAIKISLKPVKSVPVTQILGSLAAPQTLPDLLNIQVTAN